MPRSNNTTLWKWIADEYAAGERADRAILRAIESGSGQWSPEGCEPLSCSRSLIQKLIEDERATADGKLFNSSAKFKPGVAVELSFPPPESGKVEAEDAAIEVLFEDEHLLVLNKPAGMTVHPSPTQMQGTLVNALLHHVSTGKIKSLSSVGGEMRPGIVHRLDKDTSGALVISKTDAAHRVLVETFSQHEIERRYWALCYGAPNVREQKIESQLGRNPTDRKKMALNVPGGRPAVTHARVLESYGFKGKIPFASWMECELHTGRTHQIRVHLTSVGISLLGDSVYGTPTATQAKWAALTGVVQEKVRALPGQALHARVLGFSHPITGEKLRFEAEPPTAFRELQRALQEVRM